MATSSTGSAADLGRPYRLPIVALLHPRRLTGFVLIALVISVVAARYTYRSLQWQLWEATLLVIVLMLIPGIVKWRDDARRYGATAAAAGAVVVIQGLHTIEHLVQWYQNHVLDWQARLSTGLLSPANAEWVHFTWNWLVLLAMLFLVGRGMRNWWVVPLLIWTTAHTLEHTYLFVRHLQVVAGLRELHVDHLTAQGLPGIVGHDGWITHNAHGTILRHIPFISTASRLDIHATWNAGEVLLMLPALHVFLRRAVAPFNGKSATALVARQAELDLAAPAVLGV